MVILDAAREWVITTEQRVEGLHCLQQPVGQIESWQRAWDRHLKGEREEADAKGRDRSM
jgi:hypothetical protein